MDVVFCALALLSGVIGAGFASGREIARFFAGHGPASGVAAVCALGMLYVLFLRLPAQLERTNTPTLPALCRARFGGKLGALCSALFLLLASVTGGAMLAACAELSALMFPIHHAYGLGFVVSLIAGTACAALGIRGLAVPGAALCVVLPVLMLRLLSLPVGEACFLPAMSPDLPVRAAADGLSYGALNAAMLCSASPLLLRLDKLRRRRAALLFTALFGSLLLLGIAVCRRHLQAIWEQPMPFVALCRRLGASGYLPCAFALYAAALSTLCAMLASIAQWMPRRAGLFVAAMVCLLFARIGFGRLVASFYPVLGALCAALMLLLCLPFPCSAEDGVTTSARR